MKWVLIFLIVVLSIMIYRKYILGNEFGILKKGEAVINSNTMAIKKEYNCSGTPSQIASEINELGNGISFDNGGKCEIKI